MLKSHNLKHTIYENKPQNPFAQDLKIQWEINFFMFLNTDKNAPKKIYQ